jgi:phospholipid transport system substrate-binding protein
MKHLIAPIALIALASPAAAQTAANAQTQAQASAFITKLSNDAFGVLRNKSLTRDAARAQFRALLRQNFAITEIGNRLIRTQRATITPAQLQAYQAALPDFIVNTYADRLYDFADARVQVVRTLPLGSRGDVNVVTRITRPSGNPIDATWSVRPAATGMQVTNLTVNGVNVALTQEADFKAYIQRNGFDALVAFMRKPR